MFECLEAKRKTLRQRQSEHWPKIGLFFGARNVEPVT
nr:MAG TPA: hypothetical protein [Caudoviricetes sp.]